MSTFALSSHNIADFSTRFGKTAREDYRWSAEAILLWENTLKNVEGIEFAHAGMLVVGITFYRWVNDNLEQTLRGYAAAGQPLTDEMRNQAQARIIQELLNNPETIKLTDPIVKDQPHDAYRLKADIFRHYQLVADAYAKSRG